MAIQNASDLSSEWSIRQDFYGADHRLMDQLVDAYFGSLPSEFDDYFDPEMHVHVINMMRLAWDDLAIRAGKVFQIYVDADNDTPTARDRAQKLTNIAYGYNDAGRVVGGISRSLLTKVQAWWLVGCANAVYTVMPDFDKQTPYFTFRDPRTYYPPVGWTPYTQAPAGDALFAYQLTVGELKRRYPDRAGEITSKLQISTSARGARPGVSDDSSAVWVGEYYTADSWIVATLNDQVVTLARSDTGDKQHPGVNPVVPMSLYSPSGAKGRSLFADQLSIQAAMARMFSQKIDFFDRTLYPLIFHTRLLGQTLRIGPFATNEFDETSGTPPKVETVAPAHQIDADQMMNFAMGLSRMLNRNPESFQGAGQADSAKALETLNSGVASTIKDGFWPPMLEADPRLYSIAAEMDINCWGNVKKISSGSGSNGAFKENYVPTVVLRGREHDFRVKAGTGVAGYQGVLENLQLLGAENISEETALEDREDVENVQKELRRIESDRVKKLIRADLAMRAQAPPGTPGGLQPGALAEINRRVESGEALYSAVEDMDKAGRLVIPQPAPMAAPPGALPPGMAPTGPGGPGLGPAAPSLPIPTMEALQGGPQRPRG